MVSPKLTAGGTVRTRSRRHDVPVKKMKNGTLQKGTANFKMQGAIQPKSAFFGALIFGGNIKSFFWVKGLCDCSIMSFSTVSEHIDQYQSQTQRYVSNFLNTLGYLEKRQFLYFTPSTSDWIVCWNYLLWQGRRIMHSAVKRIHPTSTPAVARDKYVSRE